MKEEIQEIQSLWDRILSLLKDEIPPISFRSWIETLSPKEWREGILVLAAPDEIHRDTLKSKYLFLIQNALEYITDDNSCVIKLVLEGEYTAARKKSPVLPIGALNANYTFEDFVVGKNNSLAYAACLAVAENPGKSYNPVFLYGHSGLGKTHLIQSVGHYVYEHDPNARILYVTCEKFFIDLVNSIEQKRTEAFRNFYRNVDLLIMDDVQFISGKIAAQEELFHCFNTLFEQNKQILFASDRPPKEIERLEERVRTRFESGCMVDLQPPEFETRIAILRKKAKKQNIELPDPMIDLIASTIQSNIRELEGVISRIHLMRTISHEPITEEAVSEILRDFFKKGENTVLSNQEVLKEVSRYFDISQEDLFSPSRKKEIAYVRQIAMYLCREIVGDSLDKVGEFFGKRHHTTVMHACEKIEDEMKKNIELQTTIDNLTKNIKNKQ